MWEFCVLLVVFLVALVIVCKKREKKVPVSSFAYRNRKNLSDLAQKLNKI